MKFLIDGAYDWAVPADDVGEQQCDGDTMRGAVGCGKRVGAGVSGAEHRVLNSETGEKGPGQHRAIGLNVLRIEQHPLEVGFEQTPGMAGESLGERTAACGDSGLDSVRDGIVAG